MAVNPAVKARLLTIPEVAERLRISKRSAYRIAREMLHVEIAGRLLVPEIAVDRYVDARLKEPAAPSARVGRLGTRLALPGASSSWLRPIVPRTKPRAR